jgi:hypothetical protein
VRTTLLCAVIVASLGLAACSGGSSQAVPGSQSAVAMNHSAGQLVGNGIESLKSSCPGQYLLCVTVAKGKPAKYEICVSTTGSCTSGSFPEEKWSSKITTLKGKAYKGVIASIKPNPGNPTEVTIIAKVKLPNSHGKVDLIQDIEACPPSGGSCKSGKVGIKST